jgi:hypothetical protein
MENVAHMKSPYPILSLWQAPSAPSKCRPNSLSQLTAFFPPTIIPVPPVRPDVFSVFFFKNDLKSVVFPQASLQWPWKGLFSQYATFTLPTGSDMATFPLLLSSEWPLFISHYACSTWPYLHLHTFDPEYSSKMWATSSNSTPSQYRINITRNFIIQCSQFTSHPMEQYLKHMDMEDLVMSKHHSGSSYLCNFWTS